LISPDIKDLMRNMDSRYTLVITAAKRARQLTGGAMPLTNFRSDKPVTLAIHEIAEGKVDYFRDTSDIQYYKNNASPVNEGVTGFTSVFFDDSDVGYHPSYSDDAMSRDYNKKASKIIDDDADYDANETIGAVGAGTAEDEDGADIMEGDADILIDDADILGDDTDIIKDDAALVEDDADIMADEADYIAEADELRKLTNEDEWLPDE